MFYYSDLFIYFRMNLSIKGMNNLKFNYNLRQPLIIGFVNESERKRSVQDGR